MYVYRPGCVSHELWWTFARYVGELRRKKEIPTAIRWEQISFLVAIVPRKSGITINTPSRVLTFEWIWLLSFLPKAFNCCMFGSSRDFALRTGGSCAWLTGQLRLAGIRPWHWSFGCRLIAGVLTERSHLAEVFQRFFVTLDTEITG